MVIEEKDLLKPFEQFEKERGIKGIRNDIPEHFLGQPTDKHFHIKDYSKVNLKRLREESTKLKEKCK